jgi:hypothetical protein
MKHIIKERKIEDLKHKSAFLFFPKTMLNTNGFFETRWLERARWIQKFIGQNENGKMFWQDQHWW